MGEWLVDADVLASSRFAVSPMHEVTAQLLAHHDLLDGDDFGSTLVTLMRQHHWVPDLLAPPPNAPEETFQHELAALRTSDPEVARENLHDAFGGRLPAVLDRPDLPVHLARVAAHTWTRRVEPAWARLRQLFAADIVRQTHRISEQGWAATIGQLSERLEWLGEGRMLINSYDRPPDRLTGGDLVFVPTSSRVGWVASQPPNRYSLTYPASGLRADPLPIAAPLSVERLIGRTRATLLRLLASPMSTTQLAAASNLSLGGVADHLRVLLDAGLVERRRAGPAVLYRQSRLASELLTANDRGV